MTIDKALRIIDHHIKKWHPAIDSELIDAFKLSYEALKRIKQDRLMAHPYCLNSLPGETK